ncbi:hypothetical protein ACFPTO_06290 [Paraburkholderia denitrificans]|uniref:Uncharacterized protein n=1 Tax=Paraburkholderia denitrificans TaxID=694025 RepID=A0ABW0J5V4_9BURK
MTMAISGIVSVGVLGAAILAGSETPGMKIRLHKAITRRLARPWQISTDRLLCRDPLAQTPDLSEPSHVISACNGHCCDKAMALAIDIEYSRHEPYPREWE